MSKLLLTASIAAMFALATVPALAQHNHHITTPGVTDKVIADGLCTAAENGAIQAFQNFHANVHTGQPAENEQKQTEIAFNEPC